MRVGVFDSGLGGLTVLSELLKVSTGVEFYYLGDTARVPYGIRSSETVVSYSLQCAAFLERFGIDILVVACNTASARAVEALRERFPSIGIYEVIAPAVEKVVKVARRRVGVIGTPSTVGSSVYKYLLEDKRKDLEVLQRATPLLVPLVEEGITEGPVAEAVLKHYLSGWEEKIDTLLLGCTHYPLLEETIKKLFPYWEVVNSALPLAEKLAEKLTFGGENKVHLFFSDKNAFLEGMVKRVPLKGEVERIEFFSWEEVLIGGF